MAYGGIPMKHWKGIGLVAVTAILVCCAGAAGEEEAVQAAPAIDAAAEEMIAAANERLLEAYLARDLERWLAGFAEDVVLMPPEAMMIVGLDALREASRIQFERLAEYEVEIEGEEAEIVVAGDWAYSRADFEARYQPLDGGEPIVDRGRSLAIWERQPGGEWLISRYMANRPQHGPS